MTEKVYDAELAGLRCQIMYSGGSIILSAMGYNDKLPALLETAVLELKNYKVDPERFELLKDDVSRRFSSSTSLDRDEETSTDAVAFDHSFVQLRRDWSNHELGEPYNLSNYYGYYLTEDVMYPPKEKLAEFESESALFRATNRPFLTIFLFRRNHRRIHPAARHRGA